MARFSHLKDEQIVYMLIGVLVDFTQRWVAADNWTYTASLAPFTSQITISDTDRTLLVFYGLDTVANIVCNTL